MTVLLALDPGTANPAVATFFDGRISGVLVGSYPTRVPARIAKLMWDTILRELPPDAAVHFAAEWPIPYRAKSAAHKDVARLQEVVERFRARCEQAKIPFDRYTPQEWKGGVSKPVHHCRLERFLTRDRFTTDVWRGIHVEGDVEDWWHAISPDARDAIGVGLFHLGVTGRGGVAP